MENNKIGLVGIIESLEQVNELCGINFNGYTAYVTVPRLRAGSTPDTLYIAIPEESIDYNTLIEDEDGQTRIDIQSKVLITGAIQSLKDFETGKLVVFVLADYFGVTGAGAMYQNDCEVKGSIAKQVINRTTPKGKHIAEISTRVDSLLHRGYCYIPTICWQEDADEAISKEEGTEISITGRFQSRTYSKQLESGEKEERTAYEISVREITYI